MIFRLALSVIVGAALVWGFILAGSPATQREMKIDEARLNDLRMIQSEVRNIVYQGKPYDADISELKPLPSSLEEVKEQALYTDIPLADQMGIPYEYIVQDTYVYLLCAEFALPRQLTYDIFWNHEAGRACFEVDVLSNVMR